MQPRRQFRSLVVLCESRLRSRYPRNCSASSIGRTKTAPRCSNGLPGQLDRADKNRSALLERAARAYLLNLERQARDLRDIQIINRAADRLNREATDTLDYQQLP